MSFWYGCRFRGDGCDVAQAPGSPITPESKMSNTQSHNHAPKHEKKEEKEPTKAELVAVELEAEKVKCGVLAARVAAFEEFITEGLKTTSWNSTIASELLKK